jgi:hypothetical protein
MIRTASPAVHVSRHTSATLVLPESQGFIDKTKVENAN